MMKNRTIKEVGLFFLLFTFIFSCSTDDPIISAVTASAGSDITVTLGETVTLTGSGTSTKGGVLTYLWEMQSAPATSALGGFAALTANTDFVPDVAGDYTLKLTVVDETGVSATDEVLVTVEPADFIVIETDITTPTLLNDLGEGVDYLVKGFLGVSAALTIEPGVRIHFDADAGFNVNENGSINAIGTASDSIIFTGATEVEGFWKGLLFVDSNNNSNELTYCRVSYAGSADLSSQIGKANIGIGYFLNPSKLKIKNSLIRNAGGKGIAMDHRADGRFPEFADNKISNNTETAMVINVITAADLDGNTVFVNNGTNAVEILSKNSTKSLAFNAQWKALNNNVPYQIEANILVNADLVINAGAILEFGSDRFMRIDDDGSLMAVGTSNSPITFTGKTKTKGFWRGLYFEDSNNVINELTNVVFEYGGSADLTNKLLKTNLGIGYFLNPSKLKMTNVVSRESAGTGFAIDYRSNAELTVFATNEFSNNDGYGMQISPIQLQYIDEASMYNASNGMAGILVLHPNSQNTLTTDVTWITPNDGSKYVMDCNVIYEGNLVINPGAVFEFESNKGFTVEGSLSAIGTTNQHITFSAVTKSAGAWKGIKFDDSNNVLNKLHFVDVEYGGSAAFGVAKANLNVDQFSGFSTVEIQNSSFTNSAGYGIAISTNSSITESNNAYSGNALGNTFQE